MSAQSIGGATGLHRFVDAGIAIQFFRRSGATAARVNVFNTVAGAAAVKPGTVIPSDQHNFVNGLDITYHGRSQGSNEPIFTASPPATRSALLFQDDDTTSFIQDCQNQLSTDFGVSVNMCLAPSDANSGLYLPSQNEFQSMYRYESDRINTLARETAAYDAVILLGETRNDGDSLQRLCFEPPINSRTINSAAANSRDLNSSGAYKWVNDEDAMRSFVVPGFVLKF